MDKKKKEFCRIPVKLILRFGDNFPFDIYLKLSDNKVVKISHLNEEIRGAILRYHETKGVEDIYVAADDYIKFVEMMNRSFSDKLFAPGTKADDTADLLEESYKMLKDSLVDMGMFPQTLAMANLINQAALRLVRHSENVFELLKKFSATCPEEFKKALVIGFVCSGIIDTFDWGSDAIKEKCSLAALLCDIQLTPAELKAIQEASKFLPLSDMQKKALPPHPALQLATLQGEKWISRETLNMIEQHHEEPDGTGFPLGLVHTRISQLAAIFIVGMRFTDLLFEYKFDFQMKLLMIEKISKRYDQGVFKKATVALSTVLNGPGLK